MSPICWSIISHPQVAAFFYYIGTTKEHPPIPENLSAEAKDFLSKCLQKYISESY